MTAEQMSNMSGTEKKLDVICLGAAVVDIPLRPVSRDIFDIESYPVDRIAMSVGGDAMNEATIISRLGFKTGIIACIGDDAAGQFILRSCKKDNIDVEGIKIDPNIDTSMNIGLVTEDGERTFVTNRNGSLWKENIEHVDFDKMKQAKILSLASIFNCPLLDGKTLVKIFKEAKAAGMTITADMIKPRLGETLDDIREALSYVDYFFPNFDEACLMTGETEEAKVADKLFECGVKLICVVIILGNRPYTRIACSKYHCQHKPDYSFVYHRISLLHISQSIIEPAVATFSEFRFPRIFMVIRSSQSFTSSSDIPFPSFPRTTAQPVL